MEISANEKEVIGSILLDFSKLKNKKRLTIDDENKLVNYISGLLGIFAIDPSKELEKQIKSMIDFAKKQKWAVEGSIIELNRIKNKQLNIKR